MHLSKKQSRELGFSLIEVMLAVLVLSIGILGVSKLQTSLIRSGSDANSRAVAASLGQKKIDDLRRFIHLTTNRTDIPDAWASTLPPTSLAFNHIAGNAGGLINSGTTTVGNIVYSVSWAVDDYYYTGLNQVATTTAPSGISHSDFKMASIIISWDDVGGERKNVTLDSVIEARSPVFTGLGEDSSSAGYAPIAKYTPQAAPDVVPITIDVDGVKKETTKPLPELSNKENSTEVLFETVTYNTDKDTLKREEFRTVACRCKNAGTSGYVRKGLTTWDNVESELVDITYVVTSSGDTAEVDDKGDKSTISENCRFCCINGREGNGVTSNGFQVCRLKRVDGILRVFSPWKMIAFNLVPASYFNDGSSGLTGMSSVEQMENISTYSSYVTSLVRHALFKSSSEFNAMSTIDSSFPSVANAYINGVITHTNINSTNSIRPFQTRAVYMDYPPNGVFEGATYTATNVPLDRISFYEVNMTQLAGWRNDEDNTSFGTYYTSQHDSGTDSPTVGNSICKPSGRNCITNQTLVDGGEYSRGELRVNNGTYPTSIFSTIFTSNDGVTNKHVTETTVSTVSLDITTD